MPPRPLSATVQDDAPWAPPVHVAGGGPHPGVADGRLAGKHALPCALSQACSAVLVAP